MTKDRHELEAMTKEELVSYADSMSVETQQSWLKEDIVSAILKGQRAAAKQGAASSSKEAKMSEEAEVKKYAVTGPVNVKGQNYNEGDMVALTEEEHAALVAVGANIEGVEPKDAEGVQAAHDELRKAQEEKIKANEEDDEEDLVNPAPR